MASTRDYAPLEMLKTPVFWLMFVMMSMIPILEGLLQYPAHELSRPAFALASASIDVSSGMTLAAIPAALTSNRTTTADAPALFGWVSDHIGRENTMASRSFSKALAIYLMHTQSGIRFLSLPALSSSAGRSFALPRRHFDTPLVTAKALTNYGFPAMACGRKLDPRGAGRRDDLGKWAAAGDAVSAPSSAWISRPTVALPVPADAQKLMGLRPACCDAGELSGWRHNAVRLRISRKFGDGRY